MEEIQDKIQELINYCQSSLPFKNGDTKFIITVEFGYWEPRIIGEVLLEKNLICNYNDGDHELNERNEKTSDAIISLRNHFKLNNMVCNLFNHKWSYPGYHEIIKKQSGKTQIVFSYVKQSVLLDVYQIKFTEL